MAAHKNSLHLNICEEVKLADLMSQFSEIMQDTVGEYCNMKVAVEIDHSQHPFHSKAYRILVSQIKLMKKAINVMVENGALSEYSANSMRAATTFSILKKNDKLQIVTDFCKLNKVIKRKHLLH